GAAPLGAYGGRRFGAGEGVSSVVPASPPLHNGGWGGMATTWSPFASSRRRPGSRQQCMDSGRMSCAGGLDTTTGQGEVWWRYTRRKNFLVLARRPPEGTRAVLRAKKDFCGSCPARRTLGPQS